MHLLVQSFCRWRYWRLGEWEGIRNAKAIYNMGADAGIIFAFGFGIDAGCSPGVGGSLWACVESAADTVIMFVGVRAAIVAVQAKFWTVKALETVPAKAAAFGAATLALAELMSDIADYVMSMARGGSCNPS